MHICVRNLGLDDLEPKSGCFSSVQNDTRRDISDTFRRDVSRIIHTTQEGFCGSLISRVTAIQSDLNLITRNS